MKLRLFITAILMGGIATTGIVRAENEKAPAPKAADAQTEKSAAKPHSHMQEKTGMPQTMPAAKAKKSDPAKEKDQHLHPRDAK